jgi:hypothetical protein
MNDTDMQYKKDPKFLKIGFLCNKAPATAATMSEWIKDTHSLLQ